MRTDTWYRIVVVDRVQVREVAAGAAVPAAKAAIVAVVAAAKAVGAAKAAAVTRRSASSRSVDVPAW